MGDPSFDPSQAEQTGAPGVSPLVKLYMEHRAKGLSDVEAAQATAAQMRQSADLRGSMRDIMDRANRQPLRGDAYRSQLMGEADQPIKDVQQRNAASDEAMKNTLAQGKLQGTDFENQQIQAQMDPNGEESKIRRASLKALMPGVADGLGPDFDRASAYQIDKAVPQLKELAASRASLGKATNDEAGAFKTTEEGKQVGPTSIADQALKYSQGVEARSKALEARASAGKTFAETGSSPSPGWERTGEVAYEPTVAKEFQDKAAGVESINRNVDKLLGLMGDRNIIGDLKKRAQAAPIVSQLFFNVKKEAALRGLPMQDIQLLERSIGDPTKFSLANFSGMTENAERLKSFKGVMNSDLDAYAKTHGYRRGGAAQPETAAPAPVPAQSGPGKRMKGKSGKDYEWNGNGWALVQGQP